MKKIEEILDLENRQAISIINDLKVKNVSVRPWKGDNGLMKEYDPKQHPVFDKSQYPDVVNDDGSVDRVTRIAYNLQKLAVKRTSQLCFGIDVKRIYHLSDDNDDIQKEASKIIEKVFTRNHINSVNRTRSKHLYASCEMMTLWYIVEQRNKYYGFDSNYKIRCRTYSPINGDCLYPLFDLDDDMIALSIEYRRKVGSEWISYFDTYTETRHVRWQNTANGWIVEADEIIPSGKIPAVYIYREEPAWEDESDNVSEIEWSLSRNGNYLYKNSTPLFVVNADEEIPFVNESKSKDKMLKVFQFPKGSSASYVTWEQAIDNLKFQVNELRQSFFTQLQLPDWSYESMKSTPMSGESRKQLFIDSELKVKDESGSWIEFFDREVNVVKSLLKIVLPYNSPIIDAIDEIDVENIMTPYHITDDLETINNINTATGGKQIMSQREGIERLGWSKDPDKTLRDINDENMSDIFEPTE